MKTKTEIFEICRILKHFDKFQTIHYHIQLKRKQKTVQSIRVWHEFEL